MNETRIGFIGIGTMGAPMSGHIADAGYSLVVHDRDRHRAEFVASKHHGVLVVDTPKEVAENSDIVITMLPSGEYVREVALGEEGLIEGFRTGSLLLDTSSSEPWMTVETDRALAEEGVSMVDAPVSGARTGAEAAKLIFMVGGDKADLSRVSPLLGIMGAKAFHLGPLGAGHAMKCINNLITAMTFMATTEGLTIGKKFGLDPEIMTDVLNLSTGMSWISKTHIRRRILSRKFDDPFKLELMVKDIGIAMELAENLELPVPLSALGYHLWKAAERHSDSGSSISNMVRWVESTTGVKLLGGPKP